MKVNYKFSFLGSRRYIHGTQMTYGFLDVLKNNGYFNSYDDIIQLSSVHKLLSDKQGYYIIDEQYDGVYSVSFSAKILDKVINGYFIETNEEVKTSIPYDEIGIIDGYILDIDNSTATVQIREYDNIFNVLISLIKQLEITKFSSEGYTAWLLGKYKIDWNMMHKEAIGKEMKVIITNNIDDQYLHIKIYVDGNYVGFMDDARQKI